MFAIRAGHAFDGERLLPDGALVVVDGSRIAGVEPATAAVPDDVPVLDAPDATLLPGLIDVHVHLCADATDGTLERLGDVAEDALTATISANLAAQAAAGVTAVRDLGDRRYAVVDWNARRTPGDGLPAVVAAGPPLTSVGGHCANMGGEVAGVDAVRAAVHEHADHGVDVVKVMGSGGFTTVGTDVQRCQFGLDELRAAVDESHRAGLPITVHAHPEVAIVQAVEAGADGIEHGTFASTTLAPPSAERLAMLADAGVLVTPTVGFVGSAPSVPANTQALLAEAGVTFLQVLALMKPMAGRFHAAGVRVVAGSDAGISGAKPHGVLPVTLCWYVEGGMPLADALASGTSRAAAALRLDDRKGRLARGHDADLLLVDGDVASDVTALRRPRTVWLAGREWGAGQPVGARP